MAGAYDVLAALYSLGAIARCKSAHLAGLRPGDAVLYAGAGTAAEAVEAAVAGAEVTVMDLSAGMLERARRRFQRRGLSARFVMGDARVPRDWSTRPRGA